jgi:hypothetical protein
MSPNAGHALALGSQFSRALGAGAGDISSKGQRTGDGAVSELLSLLRRWQRASEQRAAVPAQVRGLEN